MDNERKLDAYLRGLWQDADYLVPYSLIFDELRKPMPYYDHVGIRLPDVYDDDRGVAGIDRYRAMLAHMAGHRRWSEKMVVDNWSPFQRVAVEVFEDSRIDWLICKRFPGLSKTLIALHPMPIQVGDPFAISGFNSNTRHDVRFYHIKGFTENWGDEVKSRLASIEPSYSTRMGAAMRHAAHYLKSQQADKKLMLILTDGEPADIFGSQYTIIDHVDRLPEKLPEVFISLTK